MTRSGIRFRLDTILLMTGIAMLPVYVFGSGGVQPTHILLACFAGLSFLVRGLPITPLTTSLVLLFAYSLTVEGVYGILGGDPGMVIHSVFILFNFIIVSAIYGYCRERGIAPLLPGFYVAAFIALATVISSGVNLREMVDGRATGTFNNPNQLGYFSVCLLSLTYLFYREGLLRYMVAVALFAVALFLAISSLSKAAMLANFVVMFFALKPHSSRNSLILWGGGIMIAVATFVVLFQNGAFDEYLFAQRLQNIANENDSSLASRGYFAFLQGNVFQVLFGLGNDLVDRIVGHEVHSTPGSFLNNYGALGLLLFASIAIYWMGQLWRGYGLAGMISIAGPAMLYGITHNGSRFTIFWLLVAASTAIARQKIAVREMRSSARRRRISLSSTTSSLAQKST